MKKVLAIIFMLFIFIGSFAFADKYDTIEGMWISEELFYPNGQGYVFFFIEQNYEHIAVLSGGVSDENGKVFLQGNKLKGTYFFYEDKIVIEMEEIYDLNDNLLEMGYSKFVYFYNIWKQDGYFYLVLDDGQQTVLYSKME